MRGLLFRMKNRANYPFLTARSMIDEDADVNLFDRRYKKATFAVK